ncbi:transcription factor bHLH35-like isoform X1 [Panicum miliaceum]|uniref:Transcription factor bHLH35-like isoform X1 n=1 Tax=Panicum miliaceum TaxID=4540 RepID=A0A3L6QIV4_PANMI|nr:transcription factor bHLH35-like isoform X1 [Panicum miliaceum]
MVTSDRPAGDLTPTPAYHPWTLLALLPPGATPAPGRTATAGLDCTACTVRVSGAGDKVLVVSVACRHRRDAVAKLCRALEGLRLRVIAANVTAASGTVTHTALVQE